MSQDNCLSEEYITDNFELTAGDFKQRLKDIPNDCIVYLEFKNSKIPIVATLHREEKNTFGVMTPEALRSFLKEE